MPFGYKVMKGKAVALLRHAGVGDNLASVDHLIGTGTFSRRATLFRATEIVWSGLGPERDFLP